MYCLLFWCGFFCVCSNREAHRTVCSAGKRLTVHLLPGKDIMFKLKLYRCTPSGKMGITYLNMMVENITVLFITDHKEKSQSKTNLWRPEREPGGHEVTLWGERSHQNINASVSITSTRQEWNIPSLDLMCNVTRFCVGSVTAELCFISHQQNRLWPGSTGVGESVEDAGAGLQMHKHLSYSLQPPGENRNHGDERKQTQMISVYCNN